MHVSSWLGYSWELVDITDSGRVHSPGASDDCSVRVGIVSRREKFRLFAGPSREELLWLRIVSILRKVRVPSFLCSADRINQQPEEKKELDSHEVDQCASTGCGQAPDGRVSLESPVAIHCRDAERAVSDIPSVQPTTFPISLPECFGNCITESQVSLDGSSVSSEVKMKELVQSVSWPLDAVIDMGSVDTFDISWEGVPESADPVKGSGYKVACSVFEGEDRKMRKNEDEEHNCGHGDCSMGRGERKRLQVENIASALSSLQLKSGSNIVDFGCGSGALTLPLAALFPELFFVGVDFKQQSITLLEERARKANLRNVAAVHGRIETFARPFDACVALHACGVATDLALLQALKHRAAYVMSPCCIGKLQIPVQKVVLNSAQHMQSQKNSTQNLQSRKKPYSFPTSAAANDTSLDIDSPRKNSTNHSKLVDSADPLTLSSDLGEEVNNSLPVDQASRPTEIPFVKDSQDEMESISLRLAYPRSRWLRSSISHNEFQVLARAADWSSYDHESSSSRLHSLCKVVLELDRNEASRELGYRTGLFSLSNEKAGTVGVSHVLVGKPRQLYAMSYCTGHVSYLP